MDSLLGKPKQSFLEFIPFVNSNDDGRGDPILRHGHLITGEMRGIHDLAEVVLDLGDRKRPHVLNLGLNSGLRKRVAADICAWPSQQSSFAPYEFN